MQTHRLAIELNSSADLSKSTPDGDEDLFLRHGPSSRRPIRVTVEGRLAAATISMDGRQGLPLLRHSLRRAGRGILPFGSARSVWSNTPSRPLGSDRNDVAANCRDVEGNHRLGQAPQGERAELLGFDASFERRVDALAEQDFQVDAAGGGGAVGALG
jgi:hypothetical protein